MKGSNGLPTHYLVLQIEGFFIEKLLSQCLNSGLLLKNIKIKDDLELSLEIKGVDYPALLRLTKNRYRITVMKEGGIAYHCVRLWRRKSTLVGLALFLLIIYFQSIFVAEIRVEGYQRIQESTVRQALLEAGFYEGCRKNVDLSPVMAHLYETLDNISWVGITYEGTLATVEIAEGTVPRTPVDRNSPCNIVADKEGYVERIIAREGMIAALPGTFVKPGDVLISGILAVESKVYSQENTPMFRYVHASGEVTVRSLYRFVYYQEPESLIKMPEGGRILGIKITIGDRSWNSAQWMLPWVGYDSVVSEELRLFRFLRPFPIEFSIVDMKQVTLYKQKKTQQQIRKLCNDQLMTDLRRILPADAQISNKSLKFLAGKNIIEVSVLAEVLEKIGKEEEVTIGEPAD